MTRSFEPRLISAGDAHAMTRARAASLPRDTVRTYSEEIEAALAAGDVDRAYEQFQGWLVREARWAQHGHASNLRDLVETMLELMGWMYERVPRSMAKTAALAA